MCGLRKLFIQNQFRITIRIITKKSREQTLSALDITGFLYTCSFLRSPGGSHPEIIGIELPGFFMLFTVILQKYSPLCFLDLKIRKKSIFNTINSILGARPFLYAPTAIGILYRNAFILPKATMQSALSRFFYFMCQFIVGRQDLHDKLI